VKRLPALMVRFVFLTQAGLLPWLGIALAVAGMQAGGQAAEWAFFGSVGLAFLLVALWFAIRADPAALLVRLVFVLVDLVALVGAGLWIWLTQGTDWLVQYAWGLLSLGFALVSLGILVSPGSRVRLTAGRGLLRRLADEEALKLKKRRLSRPRLVYDLGTLILVAGLAVNAYFAWTGYGKGHAEAATGPFGLARVLPPKGGDELLAKLAEQGGFLRALLPPSTRPEPGTAMDGTSADGTGSDAKLGAKLLGRMVDTLLF
jgi:hypothetical protein